MIINIVVDTKELLNLGVTLQEYIFIKYLESGRYEIPEYFLLNSSKEELNISKLTDKKLVVYNQTREGVSISDFSVIMKKSLEAYWEEFKNTFPHSVLCDNNTKRSLFNEKVCKPKYIAKISSNPELIHNQIMKGLKYELEQKKGNQMQYMQMCITWLNQESWKPYVELAEQQENNKIPDKFKLL